MQNNLFDLKKKKRRHLTLNIDFEGFLAVIATIFSKEEFEYSGTSINGTSPQQPALTVHTLTLANPLYNGKGHYSTSPTAKITSRKQPVFSATNK